MTESNEPRYGANPPEQPGQQPQYGQPQYGANPPGQPQYGASPAAPSYSAAPTYAAPYGGPYGGSYGNGPLDGAAPRRPGTVLAGAIMSFIGSAFMLLFGVLLLALSGTEQFQKEMEKQGATQGLSSSDLRMGMMLMGGLMMLWGLAVLVLAIFAFRGSKGAAIALLVLGGIYIVLTLISAVSGGGFGGVLGAVYVAVACLLLYLLPDSRRWYDEKRRFRRA